MVNKFYVPPEYVLPFAIASLAALIITIFWVVMLIKCTKRDFSHTYEKVGWLVLLLMFGGIGAAIYYLKIERKPRRRSTRILRIYSTH